MKLSQCAREGPQYKLPSNLPVIKDGTELFSKPKAMNAMFTVSMHFVEWRLPLPDVTPFFLFVTIKGHLYLNWMGGGTKKSTIHFYHRRKPFSWKYRKRGNNLPAFLAVACSNQVGWQFMASYINWSPPPWISGNKHGGKIELQLALVLSSSVPPLVYFTAWLPSQTDRLKAILRTWDDKLQEKGWKEDEDELQLNQERARLW